MGSIIQPLGLLFFLVPTLLADLDKFYNPDFPFRPQNISGLSGLYNNVGSYYNATTYLEFIPLYGRTANEQPCENAMRKTFTYEFQSVLLIAERGPYNMGPNLINMYLTLWKPGVNFSSFPMDTKEVRLLPSLEWLLESSSWAYQVGDDVSFGRKPNGAEERGDIFNLTFAETSRTPYNLTGQVHGMGVLNQLDINMTACNRSLESGRFLVNLIDGNWSGTEGWNWAYPEVNLQFNAKTANLSVDGGFISIPYWLPNSSASKVGYTRQEDTLQGKVKIRFSGIIDQYHSDVLVNDTSTPTWLRSVGFHNNSANIGYNNVASGIHTRGWVAATVTIFLLAIGIRI
ncbi:hypothetical protein PHISCL_07858 [Aspergillus sclerotialis]|uniref:Uncharacterized protein n=1 Tax=Aspergillus sclerotialis TaxID=2070753 RepID=A0A3A2ZA68_9EURO|nr:hypothetical protein PHISCL_07858 [Aspergillus sclerotialis]